MTLYDPDIHGRWEIAHVNGKLNVRPLDGNVNFSTAPVPIHTTAPHSVSRKTIRADITRPSVEEVRRSLDKWSSLENYTAQESALNKLFRDIAPQNILLDDILLKVVTLNTFYSTNIKSIYTVARHIFDLNIDGRLKSGDETLVDDISHVTMPGGKVRHEFSFATKYCSHHRSDAYPIYDSYVEKVLIHLRDADRFAEFRNDELRVFPVFKHVVLELQKFYSLEMFTVKEIDQYLWQLGKEKFPNMYGRRKV